MTLTELTMDADYPAAHSMDTQWFAVDERGQVAVFYTGENGHIPYRGYQEASFWDLRDHLSPGHRFGEEEIARVGLFCYFHPESYNPIAPYEREKAPPSPLHLDQLPARFRSGGLIRFPVSFDQAEAVQPAESYPCTFYSTEEVAYLCTNGITVKPIPGKEAEFAEFVRTLRAEAPERAARYRFEGLTE